MYTYCENFQLERVLRQKAIAVTMTFSKSSLKMKAINLKVQKPYL